MVAHPNVFGDELLSLIVVQKFCNKRYIHNAFYHLFFLADMVDFDSPGSHDYLDSLDYHFDSHPDSYYMSVMTDVTVKAYVMVSKVSLDDVITLIVLHFVTKIIPLMLEFHSLVHNDARYCSTVVSMSN
jgi:hypothetical protein